MVKFIKQTFTTPIICLISILILYSILIFPTIGRYGISWDEQTDSNIAGNYLSSRNGYLLDSNLDPTQTRLPMYLMAIIFYLLKTSSLLLARSVSCFLGALTIVAVYIYCKRRYDYKKGLLACFLIATSPFFLSFARIAYTETDIYLTCALAWLLVSLSILQEKKTIAWAIASAALLGIAISSKFTAITILPAVFLWLISNSKNQTNDKINYLDKTSAITILSLLALSLAVIFGASLTFSSTAIKHAFWLKLDFFLVFILWLIFAAWSTLQRKLIFKPLMLCFFVILFSLLTFMAIPPVHTSNPAILRSILDKILAASPTTKGFNQTALGLYFGCVLFKSSLVIGTWFWLSLLITIIQFKYRSEVRLPALIFISYFLPLAMVPLPQTFYMMPLLPILAIFASDQFFGLYQKKRVLAKIIGSAAICSLFMDMLLCYPDYNLNGYQWLGARYFAGSSSIGYRSIVQTTSDGVEQALKWANNNIPGGKTIFTYIGPEHIVQAVCPKPKFKIISGFKKPKDAFMNADFVITSINSEIEKFAYRRNPKQSIYQYPYNSELLKANFIKVFSVKRAFDIEVAVVWKKKLQDKTSSIL